MISIIVVGHGHFASGILTSLELIAGKQEQVTAIDFTAKMSSADVQDQLVKNLSNSGQQLVLCDLLGGTPFKVASTLMTQLDNENMNVLSGLNLTMLIEAIFSRQQAKSLDQLVETVIAASKEGICDWKTLSCQTEDSTLESEGV
ncbi:PTS sugar transporter subunit IIA domain-containing protein [Streptococcus ictaluri]|uniref:PTS system fructose IIA component n=1 Tax=Streptococcus ictaluri 707-05 TaxID=764299 RepID=G5K0A0_9STRE|nr:PTS sugar transporter subunit IIA [Streptococcus ictaluri]EHI70625.1 PTS system fructose IIA component [Streptococcus ictaluri 707-05]